MSAAPPSIQKFAPMNNRGEVNRKREAVHFVVELANLLWPLAIWPPIYIFVCTHVLFPPLELTAAESVGALAILATASTIISYLPPTWETYLLRTYEGLFIVFWACWMANRILLSQETFWYDLFTAADDAAAFDVLLTMVLATSCSVQQIPIKPHLYLTISPIDLNNYIPLTKDVIPADNFVRENRYQVRKFLDGAFVAQVGFSILFKVLPRLLDKKMTSIIPGPFTFVLMMATISIPMGYLLRFFRERKLVHTAGIASGIALAMLFLIGIQCVASAVLLIMYCVSAIKVATKFEHSM